MSSDHTDATDLRVLVVDDAEQTRVLVARSLGHEGFIVQQASDAHEARESLATTQPDVILLDIELPDENGLELLQEITRTTDIPVIMLTGRGAEADRVRGLELGAEDYIVKPFFPRELATRVRRAAERRRRAIAASAPTGPLEFGGLTIDRTTRDVTVDGRRVELTTREFDLLVHLAAAPRKVFSRDELLVAVWHSSRDWQSVKTVTEHIRRIRHKIEADPEHPRWVTTVTGLGYRFEP